MKKEIIISGFGGQGVMSIGKNIAEAGTEEGMEVTWVPSYGPEMRGGTANCTVILSDQRIGAPITEHPSELIAMNLPALLRFENAVLANGTIFVNSSVVNEKVDRQDVKVIYVPCNKIAEELGNAKVSNMVMLGAYVGATGAIKEETIKKMIQEIFTGRKAKLVPLNLEAFAQGLALGQNS